MQRGFWRIFGRHLAVATHMKRTWLLLAVVSSLGLVYSCSEETLLVDPAERAETYYPLTKGFERVYFTYDTTYTRFPVLDTLEAAGALRETVGELDTDARQRSVRIIDRETAPDSSGPYTYLERWEAVFDGGFMEQLSDNIRLLVLRDPVTLGATWDGNTYNDLGEQNFQYLVLDTTVQFQGQVYTDCIFILQRQVVDSQVDSVYTYEIYAPGIGLVERYDRHFKFDLQPEGRFLNVDDSYIHHRQLVAYRPN